MHTRESCIEADRKDPLASLRGQFDLPEGILYLDGNSLGPLPRAAQARSLQVLKEEWGSGLIRSWNAAHWFELPGRLGDKLAPLLGAGPGEVVLTDTISLNVFKALDEDVVAVLLSHVNYRTGALYDMAAVTGLAHRHGILAIWDLAHSAGAVPIDLRGAQADFAVGCTYKYLNAGPGAPGFIWVPARHQDRFWQPLSGWWGHRRPFDMSAEYQPAEGIRRYLCGTQPVLSLALVECELDLALKADMAAVRAKSLALSDLFIELVEQRCARHPLTLVTPREHARRGSHVSFCHPHGYAVIQALIARGVIGDYREPEIMRFGITPLYLGYADIWDAVEALRDLLDRGAWDRPEYHQRGLVT